MDAIKKGKKNVLDPCFVGLDPSYSGFGFVVFWPGNGSHASWLYASKCSGIRRLDDIRIWLTRRFKDLYGNPVIAIAMEGYSHGAKFNREMMGELGAVVKLVVYDLYYEKKLTVIPPNTLKKFTTGVGNSGKDKMLLATYKKWGVEFDNHNLADAYGLARLIACAYGESEYEHQYEKDAVLAVQAILQS